MNSLRSDVPGVRGGMRMRRRCLTERQWRALRLTYVAWLLPAAVGSLLAWPWWATLVLLLPGLIWYIGTEGVSYYIESHRANPRVPLGWHLPLLRAIPVLIAACLIQGRFAGALVAVALVAVDQWPMRRIHVADGPI
jgi:hypothetical protein